MIINKLSENSLKIFLDSDDFKKYHLKSSDINIKNIKALLIDISGEISEMLGINATQAKLFVEIFSYKSSCVIFISNVPDKKLRNKIPHEIICQFTDYDNLYSFCKTLNALYKNSVNTSKLYSNSENMRLTLKLNSDYENITRFAESCCVVMPLSEVSKGINGEYYTQIVPENAVREILLCIS